MESPNIDEQLPYADATPADDFVPTFYIGHHESKRSFPVSESLLRRAQDVGVWKSFHY
jgi:protein arginine N-methyltransferase 5